MNPDFYASKDTASLNLNQEDSPCFSGHSHSFDTGLARHLGVNAAIVFNHIVYWLKINKFKNQNFIDGRTWMYETISQISEFLGYLSEKQVRDAVRILKENGLLIEGNYNQNKFDRTTWYALKNEDDPYFQKMFSKRPVGQMHPPSRANGKAPQGNCIIQDNNQDKYQENNTQTQGTAAKAACLFGSFVRLKNGEYESLIDKFSKKVVDEVIEEMNDYCAASKPKGYGDYAAAIRQWIRRKATTPKSYAGQKVDRRTKNMDGTPVESPADGRF